MHVCTGISPFIIGINNPWYVGSKNYGDSVTSVVRHTKIDTKSKYKFVALYIYILVSRITNLFITRHWDIVSVYVH